MENRQGDKPGIGGNYRLRLWSLLIKGSIVTAPIHIVLGRCTWLLKKKSKSDSTAHGLDQSGVAPLRAVQTVMKWSGKQTKQVQFWHRY